MSGEKRSALDLLPEKDRKFVEGICAGMTASEAARFAGSDAKTPSGLASHASRWRSRPEIQEAVVELRAQRSVEAEDLWELVMKALRELVTDRANPHARAKACELMARLLGKTGPERHEHVHAHAHVAARDLSDPGDRAELVRVVRVTLMALPEGERRDLLREALEGGDAGDGAGAGDPEPAEDA